MVASLSSNAPAAPAPDLLGAGLSGSLQTRSIAYAYDGLDRLTSASESGATSTTYAYGYDLAGNRSSATVNGVSSSRSYDAANQVIGWSYDAAGNLLNDGTTTYSYDALNRLITQGSVTNAYNGDGVLVQRGTTRYTQDLAAPLSQILSDGTTTYLYGSERLRALNGPWSVSDGLGSVRQTLNDAGTPLASAWYDPWGQPQSSTIAPFGFTGELQDAGLVYLRARWYNPGNGTFHTRDPFAGWPEQPYSLHPYAYALGNPVQWTDASGRWPQGRDSEAACVARGGTWDDSHNLCRERVPLPPPSQRETVPNPQPRPTTSDSIKELVSFKGPDEDYGGGVIGPDLGDIKIGLGPETGSGSGVSKGIIAGLLALCLGSTLAQGIGPTLPSGSGNEPPSSSDGWSFIGYHGTSSIYVPAILQSINPPSGANFRGRSQLGVGFYVTPGRDAAEHFARFATREAGRGDPVVLEIYARNFRQMKGAIVPKDLWWSVPQNSSWITQFDYLSAPISSYEHWYQIKFNPRAYGQLKARLP